MHGGGGFHDQGGLRDLRRAGARAVFEAGPGDRYGQPRPHRDERVRALVEARGCSLVYLPPYSPDFSAIEEAFSKLKALLRKAKARTRVTLLEAIGRAISAITARDAVGYFGHCGYPLDAQPS